MRKSLLVVSLIASAWLCCGDAMAQAGGSQPNSAPSSGTKTPQQNGNQNSNWFVNAMNGLSACYRSAMERLQEKDNKVTGDYQKDLLKCNQENSQSRQSCVDAARKKMNDAKLPIDQMRVDASTTYQNLQGRLQTERANGNTCTSGGCCNNGKGGPALGPEGKTCGREGVPQGWGSCEGSFANIH